MNPRERSVRCFVACFIMFIVHLFIIYPNTGMAVGKENTVSFPTTTDRILAPVAQWVQQQIPSIISPKLGKQVDLIIYEFPITDNSLLKKEYYTDSCRERTRGVEHPVIYCNARFFYEIEAVLRSFLINQTSDRFMKDKELYDLARRIQIDPAEYLNRIRTSYQPAYKSLSDLDSQIREHMKLMILFFVGHELGHIKDELNGKSFASVLSVDAPLEKRVSEAVVKLCRHAEEFERIGFRLDGFNDVIDIKSEIRKPELKFRDELQTNYETCSLMYDDENTADQAAIQVILDYLSSIDRVNKIQGLEAENYFIGSLYFTGIYYLYRDLYNFDSKACGTHITNTRSLMVCMMQNREAYVKAASLFGASHSFSLLRSYLAIEKLLKERSDYFKTDVKNRTIWITRQELEKLPQEQAAQKYWQASNLQKYYTLQILMDTPIKLSHVGCSTGYFLEIDKKRGTPQLFIMDFEPMEQAFQRLLRVP